MSRTMTPKEALKLADRSRVALAEIADGYPLDDDPNLAEALRFGLRASSTIMAFMVEDFELPDPAQETAP